MIDFFRPLGKRSFRYSFIAVLLLLLAGPDLYAGQTPAESPAGASNQSAQDDAENAAGKADEPHMTIQEFRVEGNTLLERSRVERIVYAFLGPDKTIQDIEKARAALEAEYRNAGYPTVLVDIPEQNVVDGIVRLRVTEGRVDRLKITGSHYYLLSRIREQVPALAQGNVPWLPEVKKQMAELNRQTPDRAITPVMRPGREPGTLEVELKVKDELPLHGSLEVNGRNTENTTRTRTVGMLRYDNLWQRFHSLSLQYQTSPENRDEVQVLAGTYVFPLQHSGTRVALYAVRSNSDTEIASAGALDVIGKGKIAGFRSIMPLEGGRDWFHSLTWGMDYKDFKEGLNLIGSDTLNTPITYYPFSFRYDHTRRGERSLTQYGLGTTFGVRGLNDQVQFNDKRLYSRANFIYLSGEFTHRFALPGGFQGRLKLTGQYSDSPLISNEQFTAGGAESVRGYYESQALGDNGVLVSFEAQTPYLGKREWKKVKDLHALWFIEGAKLWITQALPDQPTGYELSSTGLGLRFVAGNLNTGLDAAWPFKAVGTVKKGDVRLHFRLAYEF